MLLAAWGALGIAARADRLLLLRRYATAAVVPFLAYAFLRLILVGHFGLVSFGIATVRVTSSPFGISDASVEGMVEAIDGRYRISMQSP